MPTLEFELKASAGDDKNYIQGATIDEANATFDLQHYADELNKNIPADVPFQLTADMMKDGAKKMIAKADANDLVPGDGMFEVGIHWARKIKATIFNFIRISDGVHVDAGLVVSVKD